MKKNNAGFSLIELVVVIGAMVVLTAVGGTWIARISGYRARECASKISSSLTQAKVQSMSKSVNTGDSYWMIEKDASDDKYYVTTMTPKNDERIRVGKTKNLVVSYTDGGSPQKVGEDVDFLALAYKRNTGELRIGSDDNGDGIPDRWDPTDISEISVTNGSRTYTISITAKTGKVIGKN